jgi:hypothetical protein
LIREGKPTPFLSCQSLDKNGGKDFVDCLILRGMIVEAITNKRYFVGRVHF